MSISFLCEINRILEKNHCFSFFENEITLEEIGKCENVEINKIR